MPQPIPLNCNGRAGTGFIVAKGNDAWLVTCAHLVSGLRETHNHPSLFRGKIDIVGTKASLEMFVEGRQRFVTVTDGGTSNAWDILAVKLSGREAAGLINYGAYELTDIKQVEEGEPVIMRGFPALQTEIIPETSVDAKVDRIAGMSLQLSRPSALGMSGGPVTTERGLVGMVYGDVGVGENMHAALAIYLHVIADALFI